MSQSFDDFDLNPALSRALAEMGFTRPTTIQQMVLEPALDGRDILASAPTGTGKTAAFLLPAMQHLLDFPRRKPGPCRMLILTPTRELALQVSAHAKALAVHTHLSIETIIGGVSHEEQLPALTKTTDIVVATPTVCSSTSRKRSSRATTSRCWCWMKRTGCWTWASSRT
jgi:ATP-dependent RNA helicase SrmB